MRLKSVDEYSFINVKNLGIFSAFSILSFVLVGILAPVNISDAETINASSSSASYVASISTNNATSIDITPTASQSIYVGTNEISYTNTCPAGFTVTMSTSSDDTNLTRTGEDEARKTIPTMESGIMLGDDTWGYSTNNGETYSAVPAVANPVAIIDTSAANITADTLNLTFGVKTDNNLPSGRYVNDVVYTAVVKPACLTYDVTWNFDGGSAANNATYPTVLNFAETIDLAALAPTRFGYEFTGWSNGTDTFDGTEDDVDINPSNHVSITMTAQWEEKELTMQDFSCLDLPQGSSVILTDTRDDNKYVIKKLADNRCWMVENLRIMNKKIDSSDSNLPEGEEWIIPEGASVAGFRYPGTNDVYLDDYYGGYYSFYAATAGWGANSVTSGNSDRDICPKGWRLPTGGSSGEYGDLYYSYDSWLLMLEDTGLTLSGYAEYYDIYYQNSYGYYWTSTVAESMYAYNLHFSADTAWHEGSIVNNIGMPVRCIAKEPPMQTFDPNSLSIGDSILLEDTRDNNVYTVRKLLDGKVWMTKNLRLINKTISSEDSNLPEGTTWTVPASSASVFNSDYYDNNSAFLDPAYGGYYNFNAATAGWGTLSTTSGNSPKDICPKGWRLPTGGASGEFNALYNSYNNDYSALQGVSNYTMPGYLDLSAQHYKGSYGYYWSSSANGSYDAYYLRYDSITPAILPTDYGRKYYGASIRCVAR